MSNIVRLPEPEDMTADACEWLARLERGLTQEETNALRQWLGTNPKRAPALFEAAALWDRMDTLTRLANLFPKPAARGRHSLGRTIAVAASILLLAGAGFFAVLRPDKEPQTVPAAKVAATDQAQVFETAIGEHSTIRLEDGSELTLNTNSEVRVDFRESGRSLHLMRGEIYVKVAHDEARPLTVRARNRRVQALGTAFSVEITADQRVEVIVTDGKVLIGLPGGGVTRPEPAWIESFDTPVVAGQRVLLSDQEPTLEDIDAKEIDVKLSWREGNLVFHGEPLADALGEIQRYTPVTFVIRDEELKTIRVAGLFKAGDVDGLLATLRENFNISHERIGAEKIVLKTE